MQWSSPDNIHFAYLKIQNHKIDHLYRLRRRQYFRDNIFFGKVQFIVDTSDVECADQYAESTRQTAHA